MAQSTNFTTATIGNYSESQNAAGELVLSGIYKGTQIAQTIGCQPPCLLFINPATRNFEVIEDIRQVDMTWEFVKIIKGFA